jgi:hypothetical protein
MRLVKFENGKYGIRRITLAGYQFLSHIPPNFSVNYGDGWNWWTNEPQYRKYFEIDTLGDAYKILKEYTIKTHVDNGKPV